jgi:hypothetical protein
MVIPGQQLQRQLVLSMAAPEISKKDKVFTVRYVLFVGAGNKRVRR